MIIIQYFSYTSSTVIKKNTQIKAKSLVSVLKIIKNYQ